MTDRPARPKIKTDFCIGFLLLLCFALRFDALIKQFLNFACHGAFTVRALPRQFTLPAIASDSFFVYKPDGRPPLLLPGFPVFALAIEQNGIRDFLCLKEFLDVFDVFFFFSFRRMDTDNLDALFLKSFLPSAVTRQVPYTIDSTKCPEFDDSHLALAALQCDRLVVGRIEPLFANKLWRVGASRIKLLCVGGLSQREQCQQRKTGANAAAICLHENLLSARCVSDYAFGRSVCIGREGIPKSYLVIQG